MFEGPLRGLFKVFTELVEKDKDIYRFSSKCFMFMDCILGYYLCELPSCLLAFFEELFAHGCMFIPSRFRGVYCFLYIVV